VTPTVPAGPLGAVDRGLQRLRPEVVRTLAWIAVNFVVLLATSVLAFVVVAVPPLSLLPSEFPHSGEDHALGTTFALLTWPLHLAIVAAVSRTRRARLWSVLASPVLSLVTFLLPFLLATVDATNRSVVLSFVLYGLLCRLHPRRFDVRADERVVSAA
jgi:hypothetical protein